MKRVRFAEQEAAVASSGMDDDDGGDGIAAAANDPYEDIRSAEAPAPPRPAPNNRTNKGAIPLEPFNMASERREGLVDARGNLIPFDERRGSRMGRKRGEQGADAWVDGLDEEGELEEEEEEEEEEEIAGEMEGVPAALRGQRRRRRKTKDSGRGGRSSSSSPDDSGDGSGSDGDSDDEGTTNRPLAEAAPLSGAELRALKLRLARLLRPEETVLAALRRLATPGGIAGSPASAGGLLLSKR